MMSVIGIRGIRRRKLRHNVPQLLRVRCYFASEIRQATAGLNQRIDTS